MEDIPAGKSTQSPAEIPSPKKAHNPIGNNSQWSFGWGGNEKNSFNRGNNSKGTSNLIYVSIATTIRVVSFWGRLNRDGEKRR